MGMIRLLLALAVVFHHAAAFQIFQPGTPQYGFWPVEATISVQMFFTISGFLMSLVLSGKYRLLDGWIWKFYVNRYSRLLPPYLVVVALTIWFSSSPLYHLPATTIGDFAYKSSSLSLFGIDLTQFYFISNGNEAQSQLPVPQAWSLGIEILFYLIAPFVISISTRYLLLMTSAFLALRLGGALILDAFPWQQRVAPFEMYFFFAGVLSHRAYRQWYSLGAARAADVISLALVLSLLCFCGYASDLRAWNSVNSIFFATVLSFCLPAIFRFTRDSKFDRWLGHASYPLYLVHMLIIDRVPGARDSLINAVAFSLTASVPLIAIELYLDSWRQRFFRPPGRPPSDTTRETMSATPAIAT
jgi:peptidoglycan/LPS O-acetylase OafA/YrhL